MYAIRSYYGFREDLYYRLNVLPLHVPPLRERIEDIPLLVDHFLTFFCRQEGRDRKHLSKEALSIFQGYAWPGNVRELKNIIERLVIMVPGDLIDEKRLPPVMGQREGQPSGADLSVLYDAVITSYSIHYTKLYDCRDRRDPPGGGLHRPGSPGPPGRRG